MPSIRVSSKHQVSLPSEARRRLGIKAGDRLSVEVRDDALVLRRRPARPSERLRQLGREVWRQVDPVEYIRELRLDAEPDESRSPTDKPGTVRG
jgi:AbrB family looped-hinge helix DNA binding protein